MFLPLYFLIVAPAVAQSDPAFDLECAGALRFTARVSLSKAAIEVVKGRESGHTDASQANLPKGFSALLTRTYNEVFSEALYQGEVEGRTIELSFQKEDFDGQEIFEADFGFSKEGESGIHHFAMMCSRK